MVWVIERAEYCIGTIYQDMSSIKSHCEDLQETFDNNLTMITRVILLGFQVSPFFRMVLFSFFLLIYCVTMFVNLQIIALVSYSKNLQSPMYFFLTQLSISDILLSTDIVPNFLYVLLNKSATMSFSSCIAQFYFFISTEIYDCVLLTVMSYDRFMAICNPLLYHIVMKPTFCMQLIVLSWLLSISVSLVELITVYSLWFCGPNIIDHFFCDMEPLLDLSCSDISMVKLEMIVFCIPMIIFPFGFIIISYLKIIHSILRIPSTTGRQKAFSTCSSHLTVVSIFYGTLFIIYVLPTRGQLGNLSKMLSLLYTVVTPLLNPVIYSLRNKDIKTALAKSVQSFQAIE
ncbi:PREDICTED: olfactory receptor 10A7-like [Nanorana parkeri]|uniref:olfactory receptor 10A7-like n=1 Tax=Nanorana parkeri TaxID=125878 RepID=UPI00085459D9|nr:PREDICTED: olfactory receptor 10A7-like [Nanorana parkeri]